MKPRSATALYVTRRALATSGLLFIPCASFAQVPTLGAAFASDYTLTDLGSAGDVPVPYGGMTFEPGNNNVILIGGDSGGGANMSAIYALPVIRNAQNVITGFGATSTFFASAPGTEPDTGIDGGLDAAPNNTLFYTSYSDNSIGEIVSGSTSPNLQIPLTPLGVGSNTMSVGTLKFVPAGFAGAGELKIGSYDANTWYSSTIASNGNGTYAINDVTQEATLPNVAVPPTTHSGPEGIAFVHGSAPDVGSDSVLISEYQINSNSNPLAYNGSVGLYQIDANGDPIVSTRQSFLSNFPGASSEVFDPVTGDLLIDTFGANDHVILVGGFQTTVPAPPGAVTLLMGAAPMLAFARRSLRKR